MLLLMVPYIVALVLVVSFRREGRLRTIAAGLSFGLVLGAHWSMDSIPRELIAVFREEGAPVSAVAMNGVFATIQLVRGRSYAMIAGALVLLVLSMLPSRSFHSERNA